MTVSYEGQKKCRKLTDYIDPIILEKEKEEQEKNDN